MEENYVDALKREFSAEEGTFLFNPVCKFL